MMRGVVVIVAVAAAAVVAIIQRSHFNAPMRFVRVMPVNLFESYFIINPVVFMLSSEVDPRDES